jgi:hypothetical protein
VGVAVKHRQLAHQVGMFIEHPPENSMASFNFTSVVLDEGTTFIFGSWIYVADGLGGFNRTWPTPRSQRLLHRLQVAI